MLKADPDIGAVETDTVGHVDGSGAIIRILGPGNRVRPRPYTAMPNDPDFPSQWALQNTGQVVGGTGGTPGADINATEAWGYGTGSSAIVIADLDTGIDYNHPDLAANMWSAPRSYTITAGGNIYNCPPGSHGFNALDGLSGCNGQEADGEGHGTATAGIMGAVGNNGTNLTGVNWKTSIISLVAIPPDGNNEASEVITAIDAGIQIVEQFGSEANLRVMNFSGETPANDDNNQALQTEMSGAAGYGIMFTVSTGNQCFSFDEPPANFNLFNEIAVAASDQYDQRAYWGNGECSNPGGQIAAPGKNNLSTANGGGEVMFGGTSAAAPFAAGAAALLMSICPLPNPAIITALEDTATELGALSAISTDGRRLNVGAAVASCVSGTPGTGTVSVGLDGQGSQNFSSYGVVTVTVDGNAAQYQYDTSVDTTDTIGQGLADALSNTFTAAAYLGNGEISVTTNALGPYTGYSVTTSVTDNCRPINQCDPKPAIHASQITAGNN